MYLRTGIILVKCLSLVAQRCLRETALNLKFQRMQHFLEIIIWVFFLLNSTESLSETSMKVFSRKWENLLLYLNATWPGWEQQRRPHDAGF